MKFLVLVSVLLMLILMLTGGAGGTGVVCVVGVASNWKLGFRKNWPNFNNAFMVETLLLDTMLYFIIYAV